MAIIDNPVTVVSTGGGGDIVNGIIKQFKASGSDISANTFVRFINDDGASGTDTRVSTTTYGGLSSSAVLLSDDRVFIAHVGGSSSSSSRLYGVVCTISGTTITAGTDTLLSSTSYSGTTSTAYYGQRVPTALVDTDKVFIVHNGDASPNNANSRLYGIACTISGTTITAGTDTLLSSGTYGGNSMTAVSATNNKVFVAHSYGQNYELYGMVCSISGTSITVGTEKFISGYRAGECPSPSAVLVSTDKILIVHNGDASPNSPNSHLYGTICTISGTNFTRSSTQLISDAFQYNGLVESVALISADKVFITHTALSPTSTLNNANSRLYGIACTISGTTITAGTDTLLSSTSYSGYASCAVAVDTDKVFIAHNGDGDYSQTSSRLYGVVCTISGTNITAATDMRISSSSYGGASVSAVLLPNGKIFIAHNSGGGLAGSSPSSSRLYGVVQSGFSVSAVAASLAEKEIGGLTKDNITTTTAGDIWVLNS